MSTFRIATIAASFAVTFAASPASAQRIMGGRGGTVGGFKGGSPYSGGNYSGGGAYNSYYMGGYGPGYYGQGIGRYPSNPAGYGYRLLQPSGNYGYNSYPGTSYYLSPDSSARPTYQSYPSTVTPALTPSQSDITPSSTDTGLRIVDILEGGARKAGLRSGDAIVKVDGVRIKTFEEFQTATKAGNGQVEVTYLEGGTGKVSRVTVTTNQGKIGVSVVETPVPPVQ